jgi:hypothetical protein
MAESRCKPILPVPIFGGRAMYTRDPVFGLLSDRRERHCRGAEPLETSAIPHTKSGKRQLSYRNPQTNNFSPTQGRRQDRRRVPAGRRRDASLGSRAAWWSLLNNDYTRSKTKTTRRQTMHKQPQVSERKDHEQESHHGRAFE